MVSKRKVYKATGLRRLMVSSGFVLATVSHVG